jgi:hypothetical protein
MAALQGITTQTRKASNPKAKYKMNYIRYRIYNNDGSYTYGKKYITRKDNE